MFCHLHVIVKFVLFVAHGKHRVSAYLSPVWKHLPNGSENNEKCLQFAQFHMNLGAISSYASAAP